MTGSCGDWVVEGALILKELLEDLELPVYVKATGSRGLHVVVPLDRTLDFNSVRAIARGVAEILVARDPSRYTLEQSKNKRGGRVFVDINRNAYAQTAVAPYSIRARAGAPVAVPVAWDEIRKRGFRPDGATIRTAVERVEQMPDPWNDFWQHGASLEKARAVLKSRAG